MMQQKVEKQDIRVYMLQFGHLDKVLSVMPHISDVARVTRLGIDEVVYNEIKEQFTLRARQAAQELLTNPEFVSRVERIPFAKGQIVVGFGSSAVSDTQSWFEILRQIFALQRPQDEIRFVNAGLSGDNTNHLVARFADIACLSPDWIICHISANDARRRGIAPTKTHVSVEQTAQNLTMLRQAALLNTHAQWLWMTPTALIEERIAANPLLSLRRVMFRNDDLTPIADILLQQPDPTVHILPLFGNPADPELVHWDGVHPSIKGSKLIIDALVTRLVQDFNR